MKSRDLNDYPIKQVAPLHLLATRFFWSASSSNSAQSARNQQVATQGGSGITTGVGSDNSGTVDTNTYVTTSDPQVLAMALASNTQVSQNAINAEAGASAVALATANDIAHGGLVTAAQISTGAFNLSGDALNLAGSVAGGAIGLAANSTAALIQANRDNQAFENANTEMAFSTISNLVTANTAAQLTQASEALQLQHDTQVPVVVTPSGDTTDRGGNVAGVGIAGVSTSEQAYYVLGAIAAGLAIYYFFVKGKIA